MSSRTLTSIFLIITHLLSCFPILNIVLIFKSKLIKYLILQGLSAHHLTPNELVIVLNTAEICLGQSIFDAEIREGKLTNLLMKEDFDVPALGKYLLDCYQFFNSLFFRSLSLFCLLLLFHNCLASIL